MVWHSSSKLVDTTMWGNQGMNAEPPIARSRIEHQPRRPGYANRYANLPLNLNDLMHVSVFPVFVLSLAGLGTQLANAQHWSSRSGHSIDAPFGMLDASNNEIVILIELEIPLSDLSDFSARRVRHLSSLDPSTRKASMKPGDCEQWIASDGRTLIAPFVNLDQDSEILTVLRPKRIPISAFDERSVKLAVKLNKEKVSEQEQSEAATVSGDEIAPKPSEKGVPPRRTREAKASGGRSLFSSLFGRSTTSATSVISDALKKGNRRVERISSVTQDGSRVIVVFAVNDNLFMIVGGAKRDIRDCLKAVSESNLDYSTIRFQGTFELVDKFGNSSEGKVLDMTYTKRNVERINWDAFLFGDAFTIASEAWLHPEFQ